MDSNRSDVESPLGSVLRFTSRTSLRHRWIQRPDSVRCQFKKPKNQNNNFLFTQSMNSGERFNPTSNTWTSIKEMYHPRSNFGLEIIDDMIMAIGGKTR